MSETIKVWGYNAAKESKIFDVPEGGKLPRGWKDTPAAFKNTPKAAAPVDEVAPAVVETPDEFEG